MSWQSRLKLVFDKLSFSKFTLKFGIVEFDPTFLFFLVGVLFGLILFHNVKALFVLLLFVTFIVFVLFHDFFQVILAHFFSVKLRKYIVYPFGTKKLFGRDFDNAKQEFLYAFLGLFVYFGLMIVFFVFGVFVFKSFWPQTILLQNTLTAQTFDFSLINYPLFFLFWVAFLLFVFNLFIFAMPMDGGRLIKALLTIVFGQYSANKIVPAISKFIAVIVVAVGLYFWDVLIILIGIFIYYTTVKEFREYEILRVLEGKSVRSFIRPAQLIFDKNVSVSVAFKKMKKTMNPDALVVFGSKFGVIDVELISKINKLYWPTTKVGDIAKVVDSVSEKENLSYVAQYMVTKDLEIIPVVNQKTRSIMGIIKRSEFSDYIKIHKIL